MFGYVPRHDDYRFQESSVVNGFRSSPGNTWHVARTFSAKPALNSAFLTCTPDPRVFVNTSGPQFYCMVDHRIAARRLVAKRARY